MWSYYMLSSETLYLMYIWFLSFALALALSLCCLLSRKILNRKIIERTLNAKTPNTRKQAKIFRKLSFLSPKIIHTLPNLRRNLCFYGFECKLKEQMDILLLIFQKVFLGISTNQHSLRDYDPETFAQPYSYRNKFVCIVRLLCWISVWYVMYIIWISYLSHKMKYNPTEMQYRWNKKERETFLERILLHTRTHIHIRK